MRGLGDRLEKLVAIAHAERSYAPNFGPGVYVAELQCAIRELDGQRHALLERVARLEADVVALEDGADDLGDAMVRAERERDAAIERAERAERALRDIERGFEGCPVHASICGDQQRLAVRRIEELEAKIQRMREQAARQNFMTRGGFL